MTRVTIFSSSEAKRRAETLRTVLLGKWSALDCATDLDVGTWYERSPAGDFLDGFFERIRASDACIYMFEPDDTLLLESGEEVQAPRDNLLFECGCGMGIRGKERAVVTAPKRGRSFLVKLPSDLAGVQLYGYPRSAEPEDQNQYQMLAGDIVEVLRRFGEDSAPDDETGSSMRATERVAILAPPAAVLGFSDHVPIYRRISGPSRDWFAAFEQHLQAGAGQSRPILPSGLLYYGPGLARQWLNQADRSVANREQRNACRSFLRGTFPRLCTDWLRDDPERTSVVDLGVGAFDKAKLILEQEQLQQMPLQYVAYDISFDMMADSLARLKREALLEDLLKRGGQVLGVNDDFASLQKYAHLLQFGSRRLFCLLGNTLGNEWLEANTLDVIQQSMNELDRLLIEVQLLEDVPLDAKQLAKGIQDDISFYAGSFVACGVHGSALRLDVEAKDNSFGDVPLAKVYTIICRFTRDEELRHFALGDSYKFEAGREFSTYLVKKYHLDGLRRLIESRGFSLVLAPGNVAAGKRRFGYLWLQKRK